MRGRSSRVPAWTRAPVALALVAAVPTSLLPSTAALARAPESQHYVVGANMVGVGLGCFGSLSYGAGAVCFTIDKAQVVSITIVDSAGLTSAGTYDFQDATSKSLDSGTFCEHKTNLKVPAGATQLQVYAYGGSFGLPPPTTGPCVEAPSLSGTVTVFYGPVDGDGGQPTGSRSASSAWYGNGSNRAPRSATRSGSSPRSRSAAVRAAPARSLTPFPL
jgi:hypothetical protein